MRKKNWAYFIFLIAGTILALVGLFSGSSTLDIHVHDTYFVIAYQQIYFLIALLMFFYGAVYYFCNGFILSTFLAWLQLIALTGFICFLLFFRTANGAYPPMPRRYIDLRPLEKFNAGISISIILFLIANLFLIINLGGGVIRYKRIIGYKKSD